MEDETTMETMETTEEDGFLDGWNEEGGEPDPDGGTNGLEDTPESNPEPAAEALDAPPAEAENQPEAEENAPQEPPQTPQEPPKTWTLNHQGQPVNVNEADLAMLAQRGLDSVRMQQELDETRPMMDLFKSFAADAGMTPRDYLNALRMQAMQSRGMTQEEARRSVELEDREATVRQQEAAEQARQAQMQQAQEQARNLEAKRRAEVQEFLAVFPDALAGGPLPQEVWAGMNQGLSLTASYARYANAKAAAEEARRQQEEIARQNASNAARATGSLRTAGNQHGPKDPFLAGWDED